MQTLPVQHRGRINENADLRGSLQYNDLGYKGLLLFPANIKRFPHNVYIAVRIKC